MPLVDLVVSPWREDAACLSARDVNFFPDREDSVGVSRAKAVCATCPVAAECLSWAIETNQVDGIWGGHTPKERRVIRRSWLLEVQRAS